jgi:hypothetical protein
MIVEMEKADPVEQQELIYDMFLPSLTYTPFTQLANLTGQPAMSLPVHLSKVGLPLGVQVMANKGEEHRLFQLAYQIEQSDLWIGMNGNPYFQNKEGLFVYTIGNFKILGFIPHVRCRKIPTSRSFSLIQRVKWEKTRLVQGPLGPTLVVRTFSRRRKKTPTE